VGYPICCRNSEWKKQYSWALVLTPVILASQEAKIRRMQFEASPGQNSSEDSISKKPNTKKG
jgi:hypothetical protein